MSQCLRCGYFSLHGFDICHCELCDGCCEKCDICGQCGLFFGCECEYDFNEDDDDYYDEDDKEYEDFLRNKSD